MASSSPLDGIVRRLARGAGHERELRLAAERRGDLEHAYGFRRGAGETTAHEREHAPERGDLAQRVEWRLAPVRVHRVDRLAQKQRLPSVRS